MCTRATRHFARALRRHSSDAERLLWFHLRDGRLGGATFLRRHPVGPFIAGFLDFESALIIDLGDARHGDSAEAARTAFLARRGFKLLRVWNHDVLVRTEQVLEAILCEVTTRGHRSGTVAAGPGV